MPNPYNASVLTETKKRFKIIIHNHVLTSNHLILETPDAGLSRTLRAAYGIEDVIEKKREWAVYIRGEKEEEGVTL